MLSRIFHLPRDRTWSGPLWKDFFHEYDTAWEEFESSEKKEGQHYENIRLDSSKTMGPGSITQVHICGKRSDPVLLLLPGLQASSMMWISNLKDLRKHYCVLCVDYPFDLGRSVPGHEKEAQIENGIKVTKYRLLESTNEDSMEEVIAWLREILQKLNISQLSATAGYSFGSWLIALVALKAPELLKPNAPLFLGAAPIIFSKPPLVKMIPFFIQRAWVLSTGLYRYFTAERAIRDAISFERKKGVLEENNLFDGMIRVARAKDAIVQIPKTTVALGHKFSEFNELSHLELKSIADKFQPTFLCLQFDQFYNADTAKVRAEDAGIQTIYVEDSTHLFVATQPKKFHSLLMKILTNE